MSMLLYLLSAKFFFTIAGFAAFIILIHAFLAARRGNFQAVSTPLIIAAAMLLVATGLYTAQRVKTKSLQADLKVCSADKDRLVEYNKQMVLDYTEQNEALKKLDADLKAEKERVRRVTNEAYEDVMGRDIHNVNELGERPHEELNKWLEQFQ